MKTTVRLIIAAVLSYLIIPANSQAYQYYFGNIHAHSSFSDGNKDSVVHGCTTPAQNFAYARQSYNFHFLGISEHNHSQAGMVKANYATGKRDADSSNSNGQFVCMYGMEYGVISNGGHVIVYGIDSLIGWENNNYDIYCPQYDYPALWKIIAAKSNAFATLAHPDNSDYNNLAFTSYNDTADAAIIGSAVRSGAAFSQTENYMDNPPTTVYSMYFRRLLAAGYKLGPTIDHDNHYTTFGRTAQSRTVVLAHGLHRDSIMEAYKSMRFYASDDWNAKVDFSINASAMGSIVNSETNPTINVSITDADASEGTASIKLYYGVHGSGIVSTVLVSNVNQNTLNYVHNIAAGSNYYYYVEITQNDGDKIWTAPIWVNKSYTVLPMNSIVINGVQNRDRIDVKAFVTNTYSSIILEKSLGGDNFKVVNNLTISQSQVHIISDRNPQPGYQYYRLKCMYSDGSIAYSRVAAVLFTEENDFILRKIYPNPVTAGMQLQLKCNKAGVVQLRIYDAMGSLQATAERYVTKGLNGLSYNAYQLPAGKYHVVITMDGKSTEAAFLKR